MEIGQERDLRNRGDFSGGGMGCHGSSAEEQGHGERSKGFHDEKNSLKLKMDKLWVGL